MRYVVNMEMKKIRDCLIKFILKSNPQEDWLKFTQQYLKYDLLPEELETFNKIDFLGRKKNWINYANRCLEEEKVAKNIEERQKIVDKRKLFWKRLVDVDAIVKEHNQVVSQYDTVAERRKFDLAVIQQMSKDDLLEVVNRSSIEKLTEMINSEDPNLMKEGVNLGLAYTQPKPLQIQINADIKDLGLFEKFNKTIKIIEIESEKEVEQAEE